MKNLSFLFMAVISLAHCSVLEDDPLPESTPPEDLKKTQVLILSSEDEGLINLPGLLSSQIISANVELVEAPELGEIVPLNSQYLKYLPESGNPSYDDQVILRSKIDQAQSAAVSIFVRPNSADLCIEEFEPTYFAKPLSYRLKEGESLSIELINLFCDYEKGEDVSVAGSPHPELDGDGFSISVMSDPTSSALLTFNPPDNFTVGKKGFIFELCWDFQDSLHSNCNPELHPRHCDRYPIDCKFYLYSSVEVEVE